MSNTSKRSIRNAAAGLALAAGLLAAAPAQAQFFFGPPVLPEQAIVDLLREDGFRRISPPILNRNVYFLDAIDPYGAPVRVIVGAYDGRILQAQVRGAQPWSRVDPDDDRDEPEFEAPAPQPRAKPRPPKQALAPLPAPGSPDKPVVTPAPKGPPTVIRSSPTAIPKDKGLPPGPPERPAAQAGTKAAPRVIEMMPPAVLDDAQRPAAPPSRPTPQVPPALLE